MITARKRSLRRLCFYRCLSVHRGRGHAWLLPGGCIVALEGGCVVAPGGHAWLLWGGVVHGCSEGACVVAPGGCMVAPGGHAWLLLGGMHVCSQGGMCGCSRWGMHGIQCDTEIRSMSGRYASYWNAFLLADFFTNLNQREKSKVSLMTLMTIVYDAFLLVFQNESVRIGFPWGILL